ncbi:hypothetical protein OIU77_001334 [Salix suchowensis]|uniref:Uncharacterized protein n=1 Tax=Salix suchowensis TaxID=1278906 RepID=A0ABQ9B115_9ROSI|nr:hypothetical protein OIU77_001334 [Salix suchowensis]
MDWFLILFSPSIRFQRFQLGLLNGCICPILKSELCFCFDVQIPPLLAKRAAYNVDEDDVKESWEDEAEPAPAPVVKPPPEKAPKKSTAKTTEKKRN